MAGEHGLPESIFVEQVSAVLSGIKTAGLENRQLKQQKSQAMP